jgi:hypothetical protein
MQTNNDIEVHTWEELQEALFRNTWDVNINRFRSPYIYRGLWNKDFDLRTSLMRLGGPYENLEHHLLRNFRKYAHSHPSSSNSLWNWLALAQHHGLPTRLLDWTYSPYVALHFATSDTRRYDADGVIWAVNYVKASEHLPKPFREVIRAEGSNVFTPEMLDNICSSLRELGLFQEEDFVVFLEPPSLDDRIVHQFALFSMMSNAKARLDQWLFNNTNLYFRIIIPSKLKWEARDKLDQANITERVLFPGLGGLSQWLKRQYTSADNRPITDQFESDQPGPADPH